MADTRTVTEILADPTTPAWIRNAIKRLRETSPNETALAEALHDLRTR